jgi:hypothetical protein
VSPAQLRCERRNLQQPPVELLGLQPRDLLHLAGDAGRRGSGGLLGRRPGASSVAVTG